jgi:hypothetical protein
MAIGDNIRALIRKGAQLTDEDATLIRRSAASATAANLSTDALMDAHRLFTDTINELLRRRDCNNPMEIAVLVDDALSDLEKLLAICETETAAGKLLH